MIPNNLCTSSLSRTPSYTVRLQKCDSKHLGDYSFKEDSSICITDLEFPLSGKSKADLPCRNIENRQDLRDTSAPHKAPFQLEFPVRV